jgi:hypothetical protein
MEVVNILFEFNTHLMSQALGVALRESRATSGLRDPGLNQSSSERYRRAKTSEMTNSLRTAMDLNL